ncbi:MAG TPA: BTAD domain-containing putative transcriptional regulator [Gaiellaceae bacterium]|nr:BTAD domain-containing putative transcriptional regulator [Gaiellaceae bacterium]
MLGSLLLHAGDTVPLERLVDEVWETPPETAAKTVQVYVSRLRQLLPGAIETRSGGYALLLDGDRLDVTRFEQLADEGRSALSAADWERAATLLSEALALWRGPALGGLAAEALRREANRLEESRLQVLEDRLEADLARGRAREIVPELKALVEEQPFRERPRAQLMLALYRSGRSGEALEVYRETRRLLVDELGIEPGQELRDLEQAILRQDSELGGPVSEVSEPVVAGRELETKPAPVKVATREVRKTVTVLFCDLVGSSRLGEQLDPEALRRLMSRYFEEMRAVLERHGGRVEKYIGDAVMAAFGVPVLHEDDALRAVRAAAEMREQLEALNLELEQTWNVRLATRVGVNTGEVIAGDSSQGHHFVTGEALNTAKRLEEVAEPSEILVGDATRRLVKDAVRLEPAGHRVAKGGEAIVAFRVREIHADASPRVRRFESPLVGRGRQLESLVTAFTNAVTDRACHLFTVLGNAGVGKSRLVEEFAAGLGDDVRVLRGRCLPYGEGITYWPVAEVLRDAAGEPGARMAPEQWLATITDELQGEPKAELIAERVVEALGVAGPGVQREETFWAVRKLFEAIARRSPLVVVFDDLQWAEPTFLDLVEHIADFSREVPILLLCMARPELVDERPSWGGGKLNATSIMLEPLSEEECQALIANLLDRPERPGEAERRIAAAAEGNPLFAEELVGMLVDDELLRKSDGEWVAPEDPAELPVPPTIHALLAARLERLPEDERILVERASVEGAVFHRGAASELTAGSLESPPDKTLLALVRKDVIRPARADFAGEEAFRFRHLMIRDAAYRSLPKEARADLHERFADWLERAAAARLPEFEEIVGYHLEQAYSCRLDLGSIDSEAAAALTLRASQRLESAGRRALARSDLPAAISLLERAAGMLAVDDPGRAALLPDLGAALIEAGRLDDAQEVLTKAEELANEADDERASSRVLVQQQFLHLLQVAEGGTEEAARLVEQVVPVFERHGDQHGLCRARSLQAWLHWNEARAAAATEAWEQAAEHARRAGNEDERCEMLYWVSVSIFHGPVPVPDGIRRCEQIHEEVAGNLACEAETLRSLAGLHAMADDFETARSLLATSAAIFEELGQTLTSAVSHNDAIVEMLAGNPEAAEKTLQSGYRVLEEMGEKAYLSTTAAYLAQAVFEQGRHDEALRFTDVSEDLAAGDDLATQVMWRGVRAKVWARQGRTEDGERLARDAVTLAERSDLLNLRGDALIDLAHVVRESGSLEAARSAASKGLALYEQKQNIVAARTARTYLVALGQV